MGFNPSGAETKIFQAMQVNTMVGDALVPCVSRPSAAVILKAQNR